MKKALKITGIVLAALLVLLIMLPIAFKGKIKDIVIAQGNKTLNAEFYFESLNISLIRNFPQATVTIKDFNLWGVGEFAADTLVSAKRVSATVNLKSLFSDTGYDVRKVELSGIKVKAIVLADGRPNWDIMKPSANTAAVADEGSSSDFRIKLKKLTIDNTDVIYDDRQGKVYASLENIDLTCSGDMTAAHTILKLKTEIEKLSFRNGGIAYLSNANVKAKMDIDADLDNMAFILKDNVISLNAITASIDGMFAMPADGYDMDLTLKTEKVGFKEILSLIPAIYSNDFKNLQASGDVALAAWVKGKMTDKALPAFEASLDVTNGSFRYPSLPKSVDNIRIAASAKNPGGSADRTIVEVKPLQFTMAGNPFLATLYLATPISDPAFTVTAEGKIDLGMVKEVYPLEDMELNGLFTANLNLQGKLSNIEKEQYDQLKASGTLQVENMVVQMKDMPDVNVSKSVFTFTPQYLNLSETTVGIGLSDITADCRLENYLAFALKGETIKGRLNVRSNMLDLNELTGNDTAAKPEEESAPMSAFKVPENIDFDMTANLKKVLFSNMTLDNVVGAIAIRGGKLDMRNLSFNTLGGDITANGYYSTAVNPNQPDFNAGFKMNDISFSESFKTFVTIQKLAPIFENLKGSFSGDMTMETKLDSTLTPIYNTLNAEGVLTTSNLNLSGIKTLDMIADAANYPQLKSLSVKDLRVPFTVRNGRVNTSPFDIKMADMNLNLTGSTGIDQTIDYTGKLTLPPSAGIVGKLTTLDLKIGGTFTSPTVGLDTKGMAQQVISNATEMATAKALDEAGKLLGIDISDAEKQREALITQARAAGDKLVEEAQRQSDNLVAQTNNVIAKAAAQIAGKKLVDEAKKQSDALVAKATEEGDKLVDKAKAGQQ